VRIRHLVALCFAGFVCFGLFWLMQSLISVEGKLEEREPGTIVDFVRLKRDSETETRKRELPDRKPPEREPPPPEMNLAENVRPDVGGGTFAANFDSEVDLAGAGLGGVAAADTDVVPLVCAPPKYPMRAAQRGLEGWVEVEFTITKTGAVKDPRVVGYQPSTVFNKEALRAIQKCKYNPRIENGSPVERPGVIVRLAFQMQE
jgi:periplasmic protein TonB